MLLKAIMNCQRLRGQESADGANCAREEEPHDLQMTDFPEKKMAERKDVDIEQLDGYPQATVLEERETDQSTISVEPPEETHSDALESLSSRLPPDDVPLSSSADSSTDVKPAQGQTRFQAFRDWSYYHVKCTRQFFNEKLGRSAKTVDASLDAKVEILRNTQKKFTHLLFLSQQLASAIQNVSEAQKALSENFAYLSVKSPELGTEFETSSRIQKAQSRHSDELVRVLLAFHQKMDTLVHKTMDDVFLTVKQYEAARLSYDASQTAMESAQAAPPTTLAGQAKYKAMMEELESEKEQFERLHNDLEVKMKLVNANKIRVMHQQLVFFNESLLRYFGGNLSSLEPLVKEMKEKLEGVSRDGSECLEDGHVMDRT